MYINTYIAACTQTQRSYKYTHKCAHIHYILGYIHSSEFTYILKESHAFTHAHTYTRTRIHTLAHTYAKTYTLSCLHKYLIF